MLVTILAPAWLRTNFSSCVFLVLLGLKVLLALLVLLANLVLLVPGSTLFLLPKPPTSSRPAAAVAAPAAAAPAPAVVLRRRVVLLAPRKPSAAHALPHHSEERRRTGRAQAALWRRKLLGPLHLPCPSRKPFLVRRPRRKEGQSEVSRTCKH